MAAKHGHASVVRLLLDAGSDVNAKNTAKSGDTALHEAIFSGDLAVVRTLLEAGANPHLRGWMQISCIGCAHQAYREDRSQTRLEILKLVDKAGERFQYIPVDRGDS